MKPAILVFSDLHLGSKRCDIEVTTYRALIFKYMPDKVIFAGDIIDLFISRKNICYLTELVKGINTEFIFLKGNHDCLGEFLDQYEFVLNNKKFIVLHGHQYESSLMTILDKTLTKINEMILGITGIDIQNFFRDLYTKKIDGYRYYRPLYNQRLQLINDFKDGKYDVVMSGHTHYNEHTHFDTFEYLNLGNWNYFTIVYDTGDIELKSVRSDICT